MNKIATGPIEKGLVDLDFTLKKNVSNLADFLNKDTSSLTACVMDRPRHKRIIDELKQLKIKIKLITDGDVLGALYVTDPKYNVDIFLGTGGGPEGVLAASALDAFDCHFQGRFIFDNDKDIKDANKMGIRDLNKKYELNEIIKGDSIFCSTGITSSEMLNGVVIKNNEYITETLVTHKSLKFKETIKRTNLIEE
jgi:fructose-1,6-bisphosphatase II / sedoheptulose-1,7-bisphosphatase